MRAAIEKFAGILGYSTFFVVFFVTLDLSDGLELNPLITSLLKALGGGLLFWLTGMIIADIVYKGVVSDIVDSDIDELEGGLLQRVREQHTNDSPGLPAEPDSEEDSKKKR